jgi:uncharacterized membrane protein
MSQLSQERGREAVAAVLRYGSLTATVVMSLGLAVMLVRGTGASLPAHHRIRVAQLLPRLIRADPLALTECGILLLLLTPIFRIIVAAITFALERDFKYVAISLGVLVIVLVSIGFAVG